MTDKKENFEIIKDNPNSDKKNYIFQNNAITRKTFYFILALIIIGIVLLIGFSNAIF